MDVLSNDDQGDAPATITEVTDPSHGTAVINNNDTPSNPADDTIVYTPDPNYFGPDSFTYTIIDSDGDRSEPATVSITVDPVNDPPAPGPASDQSNEDGDRDILVDASTVDIDGDALSYSAIGLPADLNIAADTGLITGTIDRSASQRGIVSDGVYKVGVTADDLNGGTTNYEFPWTVTNPSPVATNNSYSTLKGGAVSGNVITDDTGAGVDSDPDGDPLAVVSHSVSGHGLLSLSDDGSFSYTHDGTEALADSFSYTISDGEGGSATATVTITVNPGNGGNGGNEAPVATNNSYSTLKGGAVSGNVITDDTGAGVDSDPDGDPLAVVSHSVSGHGLLSLSDDGSFSYTHDGTEALADSFSYTISDGEGGSATATVTITVNPGNGGNGGNEAPVATNNSYSTLKGGAVSGNVITDDTGAGVDSDPDGDPLAVVSHSVSGHGLLSLSDDGSFSYTHDGTEALADSFSYTISDGNGGTAVAVVSITVLEGSGGGTASPNSGDRTKPVVTIHTPQEGAVYEIGQVVNADYECSDEAGGSGMATCVGEVAVGSAIDTGTVGRAYTFSVTGTDVAGNFSVATHSYTVEDNGSGGGTAPPNSGDTTKPVVIIHTPKEGAVYEIGQVVNADYECSDEAGGSGMATCVGEVAVGSAIDTGPVGRAYTFSVTGTDVAGNFSVATHSYTVEDNGSGGGTASPNSGDRTKPVVIIHTPKEGAVYQVGQVVNADYECSDEAGGSGMATCLGDVVVGNAIDTGPVGRAYTFSVTGTDVAGNQTTLIHHFTVGVQPPGSNGGGGSIPGGGSGGSGTTSGGGSGTTSGGGSGTTSGGGSGTTSGGWWLWDYQWWRFWDYQWWWLWDYQWRRLWDYQWRWLWDYQWWWLWDYQWWRLWDYQWWRLWDYQRWRLWYYQWWRQRWWQACEYAGSTG